MKQKELKNLAKKIVALELKLQNCDDLFKRDQLEKEIMDFEDNVDEQLSVSNATTIIDIED